MNDLGPLGIAGRALLGGLTIALVLAVAQTRHGFLAGMLLFFPFISLPVFYFLGQLPQGPERVREAILWGALSIPVWAAFAGTVYWTSTRLPLAWSLLLGLAAWLLAAGVLVAVKLLLLR